MLAKWKYKKNVYLLAGIYEIHQIVNALCQKINLFKHVLLCYTN